MNIQRASEHDFFDILRIYSLHIKKPDNQILEESLKELFKKRTKQFDYWVIKDKENKIIGFGSLIRGSNNIIRQDIIGEISIYLDTSTINSGNGLKLTQFIFTHATKHKLELIMAYISVDNKTSIRAARHLGFKEIGKVPQYSNYSQSFEKYLFAKKLN